MYETLEHWKQYKQEKALQEKIAQEYELFNECGFQYKEKAKQNVSKLKGKFNTNHMLIDNPSESGNGDFTEFDEWMSDLIKRNGTTKY